MASGEYVTVVNPDDVLFGRGSGPNDHEGNIKFRDLVAQRKAEYMATNHRQTKAKIAKAIVDTVFNNNGRFLKKLELAESQKLGFANGVDVYVVVDDDTIMEKAKQALRQNRDKGSSTNSSAGVEKNAKAAVSQAAQNTNPSSAGQEQQQQQNQFGIPEPVPMRAIYKVDQKPSYTDGDGYATYTTTLDDPEDEKLFSDRRSSFAFQGHGGSRRGSLLGGRKDGSRRDSMQLSENFRRESLLGLRGESMQMSELMESFKGMSTTGDLNSSSDTIGTIDNMYAPNNMSGISNMSVISMSSTTSLFKNADGDGGSPDVLQDWAAQAESEQQAMPPPNQGAMPGSDMWNSRNLTNLMQAPIESISNMGFDASRGAMNSNFMGGSSMSLARADPDGNGSSSERILPPGRN